MTIAPLASGEAKRFRRDLKFDVLEGFAAQRCLYVDDPDFREGVRRERWETVLRPAFEQRRAERQEAVRQEEERRAGVTPEERDAEDEPVKAQLTARLEKELARIAKLEVEIAGLKAAFAIERRQHALEHSRKRVARISKELERREQLGSYAKQLPLVE